MGIILQLAFRGRANASVDCSPTLPKDISTALECFNLNGQTTTYAVCPVCHCTYKPLQSLGPATYPSQCSNRPNPDSPICNASLLDSSSGAHNKPVKTFVYHEFNDYLASLLARSDIEKIMDDQCDDLRDRLTAMSTDENTNVLANVEVKDVFEAGFLKTFLGPSGVKLFVDRPDNEGRFAFVLNVDFFHPEGMSVRGAKTSVGIISMVCLNLPLEIRYKPQNMYLSIIPGPKEPHLTEMNHYLHPLIDDMEAAWIRGTQFTCTALYPTGWLTRSAIVVSVNDLPAARKLAQMASYNSHFYCTICLCHHQSTVG
jgi:hypothetical protein